MAKWIRFEQGEKTGFGTLEGDAIAVHTGDMFDGAKPSGERLKLSDVGLMTPCEPSKMICLWNNFHQLAAKNDFKEPKEPLWFLKAPNAYWPANRPIQRPATYAGKIIYEGELGVVGRDADVAAQRELQPAAQGVALDGGDRRHGQRGELRKDLFFAAEVLPASAAAIRLERLDVRAGRERPLAAAADNDCPDVVSGR